MIGHDFFFKFRIMLDGHGAKHYPPGVSGPPDCPEGVPPLSVPGPF